MADARQVLLDGADVYAGGESQRVVGRIVAAYDKKAPKQKK